MANVNYKAHLFQSIGNGKLHPSRTQCGRHLHRNTHGTFVTKTNDFKTLYNEDKNNVCEKCAQWAKDKGKL